MQAIRQRLSGLSKKWYYGLTAILLIVVGILGGFLWKAHQQVKPAVEDVVLVRTMTIKSVAAADSHTYSGEVRGRYESRLAFQVGGKLVKRNVDVGSRVRAGEALMQLDARDVQQTVNISAAQVSSAQSQLRLAASDMARYRTLYEQNAISRMQYDQYENAYEAAAASLQQASAQYAQGANQLDYTILYADSDGVIAALDAEAGQVVGAGQSVVTLVKDGEREVEISVPENRIEEVRAAGAIHVSFWALPNVSVDGKIREISPIADTVTRTYKVRISLLQALPAIKLGMTAAVAMADAAQTDAVYVPLSAVYQDKDDPSVWVVAGDAVSLRPIRVGVYGDNSVQVLAGLKPGDVVVTAGVHKLREGQKVRLSDGGGQ